MRTLTHCNHYFHKNCIDVWFESHVHCPICRYDIRGTNTTATATTTTTASTTATSTTSMPSLFSREGGVDIIRSPMYVFPIRLSGDGALPNL
jgi:hypothetical protein